MLVSGVGIALIVRHYPVSSIIYFSICIRWPKIWKLLWLLNLINNKWWPFCYIELVQFSIVFGIDCDVKHSCWFRQIPWILPKRYREIKSWWVSNTCSRKSVWNSHVSSWIIIETVYVKSCKSIFWLVEWEVNTSLGLLINICWFEV